MRNLKFTAITLVIVILTGTILALYAAPSGTIPEPVDSLHERQVQLTNTREMNGITASLQKGQYGYWVKLVSTASVRDYPRGKTIIRNGRPVVLKANQWFHIDPGVGTAKWALGYCCVGGGKGCNRHNSVPGFILRSALSSRAATYKVLPAAPSRDAFNLTEVGYAPDQGDADFVRAVFNPAPAGVGVIGTQNAKRRICAREAWFRNDKLHRIGILRKGDSIIVERYTDGAKNDKERHWAIGRGVGRGIHPSRNYGRVSAMSLCRE